jgi:hypothetical protein
MTFCQSLMGIVYFKGQVEIKWRKKLFQVQ